VAVAILAESDDVALRNTAIERGLGDGSLRVRRMALDAAGDAGDEAFRPVFEHTARYDPDAWSRWRAVKALGDLGIEPSRAVVEAAVDDDEFRVRFEAERVLRKESQDTSRKTQEG
jgi:HEAT repeat protein